MKREYKILFGGAFSTGLLYVIPSLMGYIWAGLFLSLFGSVIYLIVLFKYGKKNYKNTDSGKVTLTFFSLLIINSLAIFTFDYYRASIQRELLREIRITIDSSITETEIRSDLLGVYREYLLLNQKDNVSVIDVAADFFGERLKDDQKFQVKTAELEKELNFVYYTDPGSDSFAIYSTAPHSQSWDDDFENWDGSVGLFQTKTTLTKEGVTHERQN
ncbi:MAG: hypothetical protein JJ958_14350 [Balneola sp.]|nr:hypothetical protein [Balneola sp.]